MFASACVLSALLHPVFWSNQSQPAVDEPVVAAPVAPATAAQRLSTPTPWLLPPDENDGDGLRADPCADALFSQFGYNGNGGVANQDSAAINYIDAWTVDNATISHRAEITGVVVQLITSGKPLINSVDAMVAFPSPTGGPGPALISLNDTTDFSLQRAFNSNLDVIVISLPPTRIVPGTLYIGGRERLDKKVQSFFVSAAGDGVPGFFKSAYYDFPDWIDVTIFNEKQSDYSFCVLGQEIEDEFGACCTSSGTICTLSTPDECTAAGGDYLGVDVGCYPSPCNGATGACCFGQPYGCQNDMTLADCVTTGGEFEGRDVSCSNVFCPVPDPCDGNHGDVVYSNSELDGENALSSEDGSTPGRIVSYTVDDVVIDTAATVGGFHWYDLHTHASDATGFGDFLVLGDSEAGTPDDNQLIAEADHVAVKSLDTGEYLFKTKVWLNSISANLSLEPARYWVGLRLEMNGLTRSQWCTARLKGYEAYFKSDYYEYTSWVPWSDLTDVQSDVAFCITGPSDACGGVLLGDSDGSNHVDFGDIDCMVAALVGSDNWVACGTELGADSFLCANDTDHSGAVDFNDIDSFVTCLVNGESPCP